MPGALPPIDKLVIEHSVYHQVFSFRSRILSIKSLKKLTALLTSRQYTRWV